MMVWPQNLLQTWLQKNLLQTWPFVVMVTDAWMQRKHASTSMHSWRAQVKICFFFVTALKCIDGLSRYVTTP